MIIYDLRCSDGHKFEGWFTDRGAFEEQRGKSLIACPVCGNTDAVMVPSSMAVMGKESHSSAGKPQAGVTPLKILTEFREYIHKNFDDVGEKFAEVALRIHHGEEDGRNIRGTTTRSEEESLREEGVRFIKLPLPEFDAQHRLKRVTASCIQKTYKTIARGISNTPLMKIRRLNPNSEVWLFAKLEYFIPCLVE